MVNALEEVIVLLVRNPRLEVKAVWLHRVPALLPLHSLAELLHGHLAHVLEDESDEHEKPRNQEGVAPPERPVISGSGALTENPSKFCQHYMKQVSKDHKSYLRDTCDFLRHIQNIENLPSSSVLVTIDVTGLYTHIPRDKGVLRVHFFREPRRNLSFIGISVLISKLTSAECTNLKIHF